MEDTPYMEQISRMVLIVEQWVKDHPNKTPKIQYNFPAGVGFIATIGKALEMHLVSANPDGLELIAALGGKDTAHEPTITMVKTAIGYYYEHYQHTKHF